MFLNPVAEVRRNTSGGMAYIVPLVPPEHLTDGMKLYDRPGVVTSQIDADRLILKAYDEGCGAGASALRAKVEECERLEILAARLLDALRQERQIRQLGQDPDVHWESLRELRRACYAETDAAIEAARRDAT